MNILRKVDMKEYIDGFLLGDGCIQIDKRTRKKSARATCGVEHKEFCEYLIKGFSDYSITKTKHKKMKQGFLWAGRSRYTDYLYTQYLRWYPKTNRRRKKQVPKDVFITPTSVLLWYLGDGSVVQPKDHSTIMLRLSTDGFKQAGVELLVRKLRKKGILCHRNNENRIVLNSRGIPAFFNFIGRESPVKCYDYKFNLPIWRFESKRMKEVASELKIDYNRLAYFVKFGKVDCFRLKKNGRPRFLPEHVEQVRELVKCGELC